MGKLFPVSFANDTDRYAWLTEEQIFHCQMGDYLNSGLDLDTYMSIKDPDWPVE